MANSPILIFLFPFILPLGIFILCTTIESIMKYGQILNKEVFVFPYKGLKRGLFHFSKFMHHFYFACFAYDLSALINIGDRIFENPQVTITQICYPIEFYVLVSLGIMLHVLFYFHTSFILREYESGRAKTPITILHIPYILVSLALLFGVRFYQL